jgi:hypothetical protein
MEVTGTVKRVSRHNGPGFTVRPYRHVTLLTGAGNEITLKYLASFPGRPDWEIAKGQVVTVEGTAMIGFPRVSIGGVTVTIHEM